MSAYRVRFKPIGYLIHEQTCKALQGFAKQSDAFAWEVFRLVLCSYSGPTYYFILDSEYEYVLANLSKKSVLSILKQMGLADCIDLYVPTNLHIVTYSDYSSSKRYQLMLQHSLNAGVHCIFSEKLMCMISLFV